VPATTIQVRNRAAARRNALARQQKLNEERARRDAQELDLAADFAVVSAECDTARAAVRAAEVSLGRIVDTLIGELRIRYDRAATLLDTAEDELKRLRQVATDSTSDPGPATTRPQSGSRSPRRSRTRASSPAAVSGPVADRDQHQDPGDAGRGPDAPRADHGG
jgi:chromosome segregation ATPase